MSMPFLISVPHAGLDIPGEVQEICILTPEQIYADSDGSAARIYFELERSAEAFIASDVARAIVDLNRAADDFRKDGVIKTHTCYDIPVYSASPSRELIEQLLAVYYHPYHQKLRNFTDNKKIMVGLDCHTMAAEGPPVGPDPGRTRPLVCLGNADGTCPDTWLHELAACFRRVFPGEDVALNAPFKGGVIIRNHSAELPWLQIELSRTEKFSDIDKKEGVMEALTAWRNEIFAS